MTGGEPGRCARDAASWINRVKEDEMPNTNSQNDSIVAVELPPAANCITADFESEALPHLNNLYRTALHMLEHSAKASDAVLETYFRARRAFGQYQVGANYEVGLFRILIDVVRRERGSVSAMSRVHLDFMDVLLLVDGQGFSYGEAAEILGLSNDVVAHRVVVGRNHLHLALEAGCTTPVAVA